VVTHGPSWTDGASRVVCLRGGKLQTPAGSAGPLARSAAAVTW
jgi:hypothetical protein